LLTGHGWAAASHLIIAVALFALFYRHQRAREQTIHDELQDPGANPNGRANGRPFR
jgi:hypothetical protein